MLVFACNNSDNSDNDRVKQNKNLEESLINANRKAVKTEDQQISDFIRRYNWTMEKTGTGLRYRIYQEGNGEKAASDKIAVINYEVSLLNGEVIYSSKESGKKEFLIGRGGVESGLEEGILLLCEGDRAKFIIPSHLAYGLSGDQNKITGKATLVYDVELLELK
jgi:FKBP-type peptidyl-prolyl cis-trans isomerase